MGTDRHRTDRHSVSVDKQLWQAYGEIVGDGGRAEDIRAYIEWRVNNPTTPLPGKRLGPRRRVRGRAND